MAGDITSKYIINIKRYLVTEGICSCLAVSNISYQAHSFDLKNNKELTIKNRSPELSYYNILYSDPWFSNSLPTNR